MGAVTEWTGAMDDDRDRTASEFEQNGEKGAGPRSDAADDKVPARQRIRYTPNGPVRLTPTEMRIINFIQRHEGHPCSKAQIAAALGRNEKTVDRLLSRMRRNGLVISEAVHAANGAQLANLYRLTKWAKADHPDAS